MQTLPYWGLVIALLCTCGCDQSRVPEPSTSTDANLLAAKITAHYGTRPNLHVRCGAKIKQPGEETRTFDFKIDLDENGRARIKAFAWGHHFFDARIEQNGDTLIVLEQEDTILSGNINDTVAQQADDNFDPALITTGLQWLLDEVRYGPLPPRKATQLSHDETTTTLTQTDAPWQSQAVVDGNQVRQKTIKEIYKDQTTKELAILSYSKHKTFSSRLTRARRIRVAIPNNKKTYEVTIRDIEALSKAPKMRLITPAEFRRMTITDYIAETRRKARTNASPKAE